MYRDAEAKVVADIQANACIALAAGCFAAGTKLWTPAGYRSIEDIAVGESVNSSPPTRPPPR